MKKTFLWLMVVFCFCEHALFAWENYIVVTTIQYPTPQLHKLAQIPGWRLVVVGDKKTPKDWHLDNCDYLSPERQLELGYELATLLPWNHYSRKNIGYLFAIENGAKMIYETDDDNENLSALQPCSSRSVIATLNAEHSCINIYDYFGHPEIWPRGFPLDKILLPNPLQLGALSACNIGVEQGVVNESPDVDAIFRLTQDRAVEFTEMPPCALREGQFCPFNSQNTFFHPVAFFTLYLPSTVSMRVSDIWRGYLSQRLIWKFGAHLVFSGPNAVQKRNFHSLLNDFLLEQALYLQAGSLVDFLKRWDSNSNDPSQLMTSLYQALVEEGFFEEKELHLLNAWLRDLQRVKSNLPL